MMVIRPDYIPEDYDRIAVTGDEQAFFQTEMRGRVNCVFMARRIAGDFNALARHIHEQYPCRSSQISARRDVFKYLNHVAGQGDDMARAARQVLADMTMLEQKLFTPDLRVIGPDYYIDPSIPYLHMDVGQAMDEMGTFMCNYNDPVTAWARNDECDNGLALCREDPALVFNLKAGAKRHHFQVGDMVRQAAQFNLYDVPGFIHAAERATREQPRFLLTGRGEDTDAVSPSLA
ncbi:MAG: hypothetical protein JWO78_2388 [Micavibrio sp.]|nr:hypothetical protein [Micavibrio sp.]